MNTGHEGIKLVEREPPQCQCSLTDNTPPNKRSKKNIPFTQRSWKEFLVEATNYDGKGFGLRDIFGNGFTSAGEAVSSATTAIQNNENTTQCNEKKNNQFYTLRMEHRLGGSVAKHRGEEKILLFRSDRAGAIAKIIFSSEIVNSSKSVHEDALGIENLAGVNASSGTAHAKIHVLEVKSQYRGRDLGGLLFTEAIAALESKYCSNDDWGITDDLTTNCGPIISHECKNKDLYDVICTLDAEEDVTRYGKLEFFYQQLGCSVKCPKRIQYVNNNDSGTFRKIPMQIHLQHPAIQAPSSQERVRLRRQRFHNLSLYKQSFIPIQLVGPSGKLAVHVHGTTEVSKMDWLLTETSEGIQFCSTRGHVLMASPNGSIYAYSPKTDKTNDEKGLNCKEMLLKKWTLFVPCHVCEDESSEIQHDFRKESTSDLWALRSHHGTFLTTNSIKNSLVCTLLPSFWQADGCELSLHSTVSTPSRYHHYCKCLQMQTYDYVLSMRSRFLQFRLGSATLFEALGWIHAFPAYPFNVCSLKEFATKSSLIPSMRTLSFFMAEAARKAGLPDWVQVIALFHGVGEAVKVMDPATTGEMAISCYDWTISTRSRIVGCKPPQRVTSLRQFRHLKNADEDDSRFNSDTGKYQAHCGLENTLLMWTGCEYVYYLLKHNHATLPDEAFAMIRYFLLLDWLEHREYSLLTNELDDDMLPFIEDFYALRRRVKFSCINCDDLTDDQCKFLWESYYADVCAKYNCHHAFDW